MPTLELSEEAFRHLHDHANRLKLSPAQVIEQLLRSPDQVLTVLADADPIPLAGSAAALAAVDRLASLFADVTIPNLEDVLADPMLVLAHVDLDELPQ